jgi:hypothetical protein
LGEVRHSPGPMGQDFSGSWSVTSRHPLLHSGVTNATRSARFDAEGVAPCRTRVLGAEIDGSLATLNIYEKALFVKSRRGGRRVVDVTALCPWRYASIRTVSESTFFGDSVHYEICLDLS